MFGPFIAIIFLLYLAYDYAAEPNPNMFWDKWVGKTLWIWLPFYGLRRLIREMFLGKKR